MKCNVFKIIFTLLRILFHEEFTTAIHFIHFPRVFHLNMIGSCQCLEILNPELEEF